MTDSVAMLTRAKENLIFTMSALRVEQRVALSQTREEFVEMCSFNSKECNFEEDFKLHADPEFGNCYTFNWNVSRGLNSMKAGPMYGIRVLLFVNASDYMSTSEAVGVRVAIHDPAVYPFPDIFGYSAPVGFATSFGLKKKVIHRLPAPYGECEAEKVKNEESYIYKGYHYSSEGCRRSCFQNALLERCGCGDPRFPLPNNTKHCSAFDPVARSCLERTIVSIGDFHHMSEKQLSCRCLQPCENDDYGVTFSTAKWPSGATDLGDCEGMNTQECEEYYSKHAAMVEVFFEQLNYELLMESEAYGLVNLLADIGGHLGLWMGFSVITIIEWVVLFFDLITLCCLRRRYERSANGNARCIMNNSTDENGGCKTFGSDQSENEQNIAVKSSKSGDRFFQI
ncbi:hypothetical protein AB6A40_009130 [Gnathostoma spinigerum]|uniref:Amiloride-sensitive sodium channel n=1 Tax=Gnathostoma spinigerum TaxID=75299 RepID=A0ABD6EY64_9BILA